MAEQKAEYKKPGIVRRILKWIGLGLLALLLALAIIFQAPWKVTAVLLLILLACTILPKPARRWFWLSVGVIILVLIIWVFLPVDQEGWRPYVFKADLAVLRAKYAVPDAENAAVIYDQLLEIWQVEDENEPNVPGNYYSLTGFGPWSRKDYPEIAQWLEWHQSTIAKLLEASRREKCAFLISDTIMFGDEIGRLPATWQWAHLLIAAANNDLAEGRIDSGLEKYLCVIQMADHICQQPTMIDTLVGIALEALAIRQFNRFVVTGAATEEHLSVIEKALIDIKHDWSSDLSKILKCEKLLFKNALGMFYEVNPEGRTRLNRGSGLSFSFCGRLKCELPKRKAKRNYWRRKLTKAGTILGWFYMPSTPQKASEIIDAGYERLYAMAEPDFDWQKEPKKPSLCSIKLNLRYTIELGPCIMEPAFRRIHDLYLRNVANKRGSQITIPLRRYKNKHGHWPESLDDVKPFAPEEIFVDPINSGSFVYKLTEENFTLYSKGKNNIDENGKYKDGADDWLIWPPKSRKSQEKNADAEQQ